MTMKRRIKLGLLRVLLIAYACAFRAYRVLHPGVVMSDSVLVLPPYSPGSLGDEAIMTAGVQQLRACGRHTVGLVAYTAGDDWAYLQPLASILDMERFFFQDCWRARFRFVREVSRYQHFYLFGTDVMDGFYGEGGTVSRMALVNLAAMAGVPVTIGGFSFNENPTPGSVAALRTLSKRVRLCSRDPVSHGRLTRALCRSVDLTADIAFLLKPVAESEVVGRIATWAAGQRAEGRIVVGVNASAHLLKQMAGLRPEQLAQSLASAIEQLFAECAVKCMALSVLMIPHDVREEVNDTTLAAAVVRMLPSEMRRHCLQVPTPVHATEIKAICALLDIVISGRMHVAIACLGQGTPVACITYQGKFEGLFEHFGLPGMTITPEQALCPRHLASFFLPLIEQREELRRHIRAQLSRINWLAQANFSLNKY